MEWFNRGANLDNMDQARGFFERALALDPNNVDALLGEGRVDYEVGAASLSDDRPRGSHRRKRRSPRCFR